MTNWFLRLKHWQLFMLVIVLPYCISIIYVTKIMFSVVDIEASPDPKSLILSPLFLTVIIVGVVATILYTGWQWSIGIGLQHKIQPDLRLKTSIFKISVLIPLVTGCLAAFFAYHFVVYLLSFEDLLNNGNHEDIAPALVFATPYFILIMIMSFISLIASIYNYYFTGKTIKTLELNREVHFQDYILESILVWFYLVGIWILQPKFNKWLEK